MNSEQRNGGGLNSKRNNKIGKENDNDNLFPEKTNNEYVSA